MAGNGRRCRSRRDRAADVEQTLNWRGKFYSLGMPPDVGGSSRYHDVRIASRWRDQRGAASLQSTGDK